MLIQLLTQHPEAIVQVLSRTPSWVWGLFAALLALGLSQVRDRTASLLRVSLMPIGMTAFSIWGTVSAFGTSPLLSLAECVWVVAGCLAFALVVQLKSSARYDSATRSYAIPGSLAPLFLILGIFLVKYVVGVDLAMAPQLMRDTQYALTVAALYGAFTGIFIGRAARLWRLALPGATPALA